MIPKIGCLHFMSVVKHVRSEPHSLLSSLSDMIDNIYGLANISNQTDVIANIRIEFHPLHPRMPYKIIVSDNLRHGFQNLFEEASHNPLNMGHIREGHSNDQESSEFGTGLKKAMIFMAEHVELYTRSISEKNKNKKEHYVKVVFDIPEMMKRPSAQESYEPTSFEIISPKEFEKMHSLDSHGSTILLQNLNENDFSHDPETGLKYTQKELETFLHEKLSRAYSDLIRKGVFRILLNDQWITVQDDLVDKIPKSHKLEYTFYTRLNSKNEPESVFRNGHTPTGRVQTMEYDPISGKFIKLSYPMMERINLPPIQLVSLSTKHTSFDTWLSYDYTDIVRGGRCFDPPIKFVKQETDGYSNHIYNRLTYESKKLNKALGIGPNKKVTKPNNMLISAIQTTLKQTTYHWRKEIKLQQDHLSLPSFQKRDENTTIHSGSVPFKMDMDGSQNHNHDDIHPIRKRNQKESEDQEFVTREQNHIHQDQDHNQQDQDQNHNQQDQDQNHNQQDQDQNQQDQDQNHNQQDQDHDLKVAIERSKRLLKRVADKILESIRSPDFRKRDAHLVWEFIERYFQEKDESNE